MLDKNALARLARDAMDTEEYEIPEDEAIMQMLQSAEAELSEAESRRRFPDLWQYFRFHPDAREEYDILVETMALKASGGLERTRSIPPRPDAVSMWEQVKDVITRLFPAFDLPQAAPALSRGEQIRASFIELNERYQLSVSIEVSDKDPGQRRLGLTVRGGDRAAMEGTPVWLQVGADGPTIQEQSLDDMGLAALDGVAAGVYTLRLYLGGQHYAVTDLTVP